MDQNKLRTLVFEKTGIKIDVDDPVFALVALNEAVLEEAVLRHVAAIDTASQDVIEQIRTHAPAPRKGRAKPTEAPPPPPAFGPPERRMAALAAGAAVLGALLVLLGQALFFKPAPAPAPVVQARQLTPEQQAALRNGEKLARVVDKLDAKTRAAIKAEMAKP
ncbi:MAG TPA: hypothetical protein VFF16_03815 [Telluria sp.]|nr:hypothetical protein [Telluria sp.]